MRDISELPLLDRAAEALTPGLVWAYAAMPDGEGRAVRLSPAEIGPAIAERAWVWLHVDLVDQRAQGWLRSLCDLPPGAAALFAGVESPVPHPEAPGEIHGFAADFLSDFSRVSASVGRYAFSACPRLLVTGRRHPLAGIEAARRALEDGAARPASGYGVLAMAVAAFCRVAMRRLEAAQSDIDAAEDRLLADGPGEDPAGLKEVRRLALALHRPVAATILQLEDAAQGTGSEAASGLPPAALVAIDDMVFRLRALDQAVVQASDRARLLRDEAMAELAHETNRSLRALTVMSAFLLPGTLIAGVFGMNTGGLFFESPAWGTLAALSVGALATAAFWRLLVRIGAIRRP